MKAIVFFLGFMVVGCSPNSKDKTSIERFVFIDDEGICHVNNDCPKLVNGKDSYGHSIYAMQPCDTAEFAFDNSDRVCSNCVSVADFEQLKTISERNKRHNADRVWIYNKLVNANYDMEPYDEFVKHISDTERRRRLHKTALDEGWDVGTFDEFSKGLGFSDIE